MSVFAEIDANMGVETEENNEVKETVVDNTTSEVTKASSNESVATETSSKDDASAVEKTIKESSNKEITTERKAEVTAVDDEEELKVPEINYDDFKPIINFNDLSDDEIIDTALNRLMQDTYFGINGLPLIACFLYVYNRAKKDINFAEKVLLKSKNFANAFKYLEKQIKALANGSNGIGLDHRQIFAILDDYYFLDDIAIAEKEARAKAIANKKKTRKSKTETKVATKVATAKKEKKSKEKVEEQPLNLFSMM